MIACCVGCGLQRLARPWIVAVLTITTVVLSLIGDQRRRCGRHLVEDVNKSA
jgi:hypothetical protein